jgi:hypothetical protein
VLEVVPGADINVLGNAAEEILVMGLEPVDTVRLGTPAALDSLRKNSRVSTSARLEVVILELVNG